MKFLDLIQQSTPRFRKNLIFFLVAYFMAIFNYPLVKASTTSMFLEAFGAKSSPAAWAWAIVFLSISIFICNRIQKILSVQLVFAIVSAGSVLIFLSGHMGIFTQNTLFTYISFVWKEICVILQIHLLLGYANTYFRKEDFKILLGPIGASGSLGGVAGGLLTTYLSSAYGTFIVLMVGVLFVALPIFLFLPTQKIGVKEEEKISPLESLDTPDVRKYVFYIATIVALTQFIINIADFRFNIVFEQTVLDSDLRTGYLGNVFTLTNALTFVFQFLFLPFVLPRVKEKNLHLYIPISYLFCVLILMIGGQLGLYAIAGIYIYLKAADYSFFSAGKELLYQPLIGKQKYGAKYLTDMLVYRSSKALIALILIYLQSSSILNMMMMVFLLLWLITVVKLFKLHQKLFS